MPRVAARTRGWRCDLAPLGIPTTIRADDPQLLTAACAAYRDWVVDDPIARPAIEIRLRLAQPRVTGADCGVAVTGDRLSLTGPDLYGGADARTGRGTCAVSTRLLDDIAALQSDVIDPILLFLLARLGRPPLHAAGFLLGDRAVLLAGPSGSGKSTLALAAASQSLPVLSDDTVHLQLEPALRVWGFAQPVHVFADEAPPGDHVIRLRQGRRKAGVILPAAAHSRRYADHVELVLLTHGSELSLDRIDRPEAMTALSRLEPGFDLLPRESALVADALTLRGAWRLTLTDDPAGALALLRAQLG